MTESNSSAHADTPTAAGPGMPAMIEAAGPVRSPLTDAWTIDDAAELYLIRRWGAGFFDVGERGTVEVRPGRTVGPSVDLHEIVEGLRERGYRTPVLVHFSDVLDRRIEDLHEAFRLAIEENEYGGAYRAVYPIKVNQRRRVVEEIAASGARFGFGLEVGSKPELLAVLGMTAGEPERLIVCNGFKETRYVEFVTLAAKLGRNIVPVIENLGELRLIVDCAERFGVRPTIGLRVNLGIQGAGRWRHSSGMKAKFGLALSEILEAFEYLRARGMEDCLQLLHCHMGSQLHDIRRVAGGVNELARIYVELAKLGANMRYLDVGGGLGVDYDGSRTNFEFSTNYSLEEYASTVVHKVLTVCDAGGVPHPTIVTESGRAMSAMQSVLVFDVLGANRPDRLVPPDDYGRGPDGEIDESLAQPIQDLLDALERVRGRRALEAYHDALQARDEATTLFSVGHLSLSDRAMVDRLFWTLCARLRDRMRSLPEVPEELEDLEEALSDTCFCNLSVFQSLPDVWAIKQLFPIMPIHRLDERPTRRATIADLTCDSDGRIDRFVDQHDVRKAIELHDFEPGERYLLGAFLVGAYQEILGDLHNLFGDTHVAHVRIDEEDGSWWIDDVTEGDRVRDVLGYVQFDARELMRSIRTECEGAVRTRAMDVAEAQQLTRLFQSGLDGYTYLESDGVDLAPES